jgi:hypothetical protein
MRKPNFMIYFSLFLILLLISGINEIFSQNKSNIAKEINGKTTFNQIDPLEIILDSNLDFEDAVIGLNIPHTILENLELVTVYYYGFDDRLHQGQLVVHKDASQDIREILKFIKDSGFPLNKVVPISKYNWSDEESMKDNNTTAFNYRFISGTRVISKHANGLAIDINPLLNPYIKNGVSIPTSCTYDTTKAGTISSGSQLVYEFKKRGWTWGGDWKSLKDYQHFEKKLK